MFKNFSKKESIVSSMFCAFLLLSALSAFSQDIFSGKVDEFIKAEMQKQKIPGVAIAVVKDGKPVLVKGYGFSNVEHQVPVKPETIFQSGSVGKQFTAMAVMTLVDEGKINLDEKIGKYLGEVPDSWKNITVRHLLTHTGGMTDYPQDFNFWRDYTEDELLKKTQTVPTAFAPGEKWQYSNLGYQTLGILIHKVSGKFYGDLLQDRVFKPLGMTNARVINEADIIPNRAMGYVLQNGELKHQTWVAPTVNTTADGALYFTVLDMIKWDDALNQRKIIKKESYDQMWSPVKLNNGTIHPYGFGWMFAKANGHQIIEHGGAWQGFKAHIARYPDDKLTVIVFANLIQTNQGLLAHKIAEIYEPALIAKAVEDTEPQVTAVFREQLRKIAEGKPDLDLYGAEMRKALTEQRDQFAAFIKGFGEIKTIELLERTQNPAGTVYRYRVQFDRGAGILRARRLSDGKIAGMTLQPE